MSEAPAPKMEIEITPQMIEAGVDVLQSLGVGLFDVAESVCEDVLVRALQSGGFVPYLREGLDMLPSVRTQTLSETLGLIHQALLQSKRQGLLPPSWSDLDRLTYP